jgi:hypothetical protein
MWTLEEAALLKGLKTPWDLQVFLNSLGYNDKPLCKSPRGVLREKTAHCAEGAYLAAAALRFHGHSPLVVDLRAENDDDHLLAVFRRDGLWGAVAKSNTTVLRYREPVYRSLRELVMSYFDMYFNTRGEKTLREYSRPLDLSRFDDRDWMWAGEDLEYIGSFIDRRPHTGVVSAEKRETFAPADPDLVESGFSKALKSGLYRPE